MGKIDGDMKTFGGMSFEDMQKRFEQIQSKWNALTPEQQEEERKRQLPMMNAYLPNRVTSMMKKTRSKVVWVVKKASLLLGLPLSVFLRYLDCCF
jgi:hypothetical protein